MRHSRDFNPRALCRLLVAVVALAGFQVAHAGFSTAQSSSGWSIDWDSGTMQPSAQFVPTPGPTTSVSGNTGYSVQNGALVGQGTYRAPIGPSYIDVQAKVIPDKVSLGRAVANFAGKLVFPLQLGIAAYDLIKDIGWDATRDQSGQLQLSKPDPTVCTTAPCYQYKSSLNWSPAPYTSQPWDTSQAAACTRQINWMNAHAPNGSTSYSNARVISGSCRVTNCYNGNCSEASYGYSDTAIASQTVSPSAPVLIPATLDDLANKIASESGWPSSNTSLARTVSEAVKSGETLSAPAPTVSGPSSVQGPSSTSTNGNVTETKQTVYNITYNNNQVAYTTTVTTTTNNAGTVTTKTETSQNDKPKSECELNPDSLNCANLDVPEGTIPKTTKNITYTAETWFGGGSCPADKFLTTHGQQIKVWDWQSTCSNLVTYFRPILLIVAGVMAMFIVLPKGAAA